MESKLFSREEQRHLSDVRDMTPRKPGDENSEIHERNSFWSSHLSLACPKPQAKPDTTQDGLVELDAGSTLFCRSVGGHVLCVYPKQLRNLKVKYFSVQCLCALFKHQKAV